MAKECKSLQSMVVVVLGWIGMMLSDIFIQFSTVKLNIMVNIKRQLSSLLTVFIRQRGISIIFICFVDILGKLKDVSQVSHN